MGGSFSSNDKSWENSSSKPEEEEVGTVKVINSIESWKTHFNHLKNSPNLVVIDFMALKCGPCRVMESLLNNYAPRLTDVEFIKIDVDQLKDVAEDFQVQGMPTCVFLKKGKEVDRVVGAKKDEFVDKIEEHRYTQASA